MTEKLLTPTELAERLGVTRQTIYRWANENHLPYHEIGPFKRKRFRESEVKEWYEGGHSTEKQPTQTK